MLLRFKVKNFLSFYEETVFDMFPNPKRNSFVKHIYSDLEIPVLKEAGIYGANGSGKSNFIKAIQFLKNFITDKDFLKEVSLAQRKFRLCEKNEEFIEFTIEFLSNKKYYSYFVAFSDNGVEVESLSKMFGKKYELLFTRKKSVLKSTYGMEENAQLNDVITKLLRLNPKSSLLTLNNEYPIIPTKDLKWAYKWFSSYLQVLCVHSYIPDLIDVFANNAKALKYTNDVFPKIGIGIKEVLVESQTLDKWLAANKDKDEEYGVKRLLERKKLDKDITYSRLADNATSIISLYDDNGITMVRELLFKQMGKNGYIGQLEADSQSDGTCRILALLPALFDATYNGNVILIDEIENSIHPNLIKALLKFFSESSTNGQLIFTSHDTGLLNQQELFRPDEIWFTEKSDGSTGMYSLNDFKEHHTISVENGYLDGRYGAIPVIEDL